MIFYFANLSFNTLTSYGFKTSNFLPGNFLLLKPGLSKDDFNDFEVFKDKVLGYMKKGFAVEDLRNLSKYEQMLEVKYRIVIDEIKKSEQSPLVKFIHSPVREGLFTEKIFKLSGEDFFGKVLPYVN